MDGKPSKNPVPPRRPVTCVETKETFRSGHAIATAMGVSPTSVSCSIYRGTTCCGLHFAHADAGAEVVSVEGSRALKRARKNGKYSGIRKAVMCVETGRVWPSQKAAADSLFVSPSTIASRVDHPDRTTAGGLHLVTYEKYRKEARRKARKRAEASPDETSGAKGEKKGAA